MTSPAYQRRGRWSRRLVVGLASIALTAVATAAPASGVTSAPAPSGVGAEALPAGASAALPMAGTDGACTDDSGVTVVVDFQELGGGIVVRCAGWPLPGNGTGLDALQAAGVPVGGVQRWGLSFICRLYDRPSASQSIPVRGDTGYREACIDTPPAAAYWSYWHAPNGGSWTYSQFGVKNRKAIKGGYEGWSFSLNRTADSNPIPRVAPRHQVTTSGEAQPAAPRTTTAPSTPSQPQEPNSGGDSSLAPEPGSGLPGDPLATESQQGSGDQPTAGGAAPSGASESASEPSGSAATSGTSGTSGRPSDGEDADRPDLVVDSDELAAGARAPEDDGISPALIGGLGLIGFLLVMTIGTLLRRRGAGHGP